MIQKKPSIWFFNRAYPPSLGATGRLLADLAEKLAQQGFDVTVFTAGPEACDVMDRDVRVIRVRDARSKTGLQYMRVWLVLFLKGICHKGKPDLIVTMTDPPLLVIMGAFLAFLKKTKHMHWVQDVYPDLFPHVRVKMPKFLMYFLKSCARVAMNSADRIVVIGRCMGRYLALNAIQAKKMVFIKNWPDKELVQSFDDYRGSTTAVQRLEMRSSSGKKLIVDERPKFRVLYAGTLGRAHPIDTILQAAVILQDKLPDVEFLFVGHPSQQEELAKERERLGLSNVRMLPLQPHYRLAEMMYGGDVHLISMKDSVLGMMVPSKLSSAMAAERPCIFIGPELSETAKVIHEFEAGTVLSHGDVQGLVAAIEMYRYDQQAWFSAHEGARKASAMTVRDELIDMWIKKAKEIMGYSVQAH